MLPRSSQCTCIIICTCIQVESLTAARKAAMSGNEPSDAIRVVNALLTQIDQIKRYPNVIILTTSNVTGAIDLAFVDRSVHYTLTPLDTIGIRKLVLLIEVSKWDKKSVPCSRVSFIRK